MVSKVSDVRGPSRLSYTGVVHLQMWTSQQHKQCRRTKRTGIAKRNVVPILDRMIMMVNLSPVPFAAACKHFRRRTNSDFLFLDYLPYFAPDPSSDTIFVLRYCLQVPWRSQRCSHVISHRPSVYPFHPLFAPTLPA